MLVAGLSSLTACRQDTDDLSVAASRRLQMGACMTRTDDTFANATQLTFFMANGSTAECQSFTYDAHEAVWNTGATVMENTSYKVFGYMPSQGAGTAAIQPLNGDYAYGAEMTVSGLPTMTATDVCFVIAVKGGNEVTAVGDFVEWSYGYAVAEEDGDKKYINFLLDHLYANLNLLFKVQEGYTQKRTIKLKKVELSALVSGQVDVSITQPEGTLPVVAFTPMGSGSVTYTLLDSPDGIELSTVTPMAANIFVAPGVSSLTLRCTYDIYNEAGHIIRRDCTTENVLTEERTSLEQGYRTDLSLTVNPTYFYVLSDEDAPELELSVDY